MLQATIFAQGFVYVSNELLNKWDQRTEVRGIEVVGWNSVRDTITMVTYQVTYVGKDGELETTTYHYNVEGM